MFTCTVFTSLLEIHVLVFSYCIPLLGIINTSILAIVFKRKEKSVIKKSISYGIPAIK